MPQFGIVVHGGAGTILREKMTPEVEAGFRAGLTDAITSGYAILEKGGSSLDAVHCAVNSMENNPLFNAGKGAVFTSSGGHQMDASIMDGRTLAAGAVAAVQHVRNPITLARMVMEKSPHVLLVGDGAEQFGRMHGIELADDDYFHTQRRWEQLLEAKAEEEKKTGQPSEIPAKPKSLGTVGAVALDRDGNLAAATSTGGMSNSRYGRVGDSPIIGAGTYANNKTCAVSTTGHGEFLIRSVLAYDLSALMEYGGLSLAQAADKVIHGSFAEMGGTGGLIAINRQGEISLPFNTPGMYRGHLVDGDKISVAIYRVEQLLKD
jgi:L-asparaginase / beta-aspartyl-peptidase